MNEERAWHKILDSFHDYRDIIEHCGACKRKPKKKWLKTFLCNSAYPACARCRFAKQLKKEGWCF